MKECVGIKNFKFYRNYGQAKNTSHGKESYHKNNCTYAEDDRMIIEVEFTNLLVEGT